MYKQFLMKHYGAKIRQQALGRIAIIGSGSWATALVKIFSESGAQVFWLVRNNDQAASILCNGCNPRYLSSAKLNLSSIMPSANIEDVLQEAELVIFAVPAEYLADSMNKINPDFLINKILAVSIKGFVPGTASTPSNFIKQELRLTEAVNVIAGPCHAEEIAYNCNTYITIAGENASITSKICKSINTSYMHAIPNNDPAGVEYVSILKNIVGIATGIANGLNYGVNFQAAVVSNAMREIETFLQAVNPKERCLHDSAYFGDLLVTAYSNFSRNRTLGKLVGRGIHISRALQEMAMVAEGYHASNELASITSKIEVQLPVITSVHRILHQHANPFHEFKLLEKQLR